MTRVERVSAQALLLVGALCCTLPLRAQTPVCAERRYGSAADARAIEIALQQGSIAEAQAAIRAAQATRGIELGCAEMPYEYGDHSPAAPTAAQIAQAWQLHAATASAAAERYTQCPPIGRAAGAYALGGFGAHSGGLDIDLDALHRIADAFLHTQYLPQRTPGVSATWPGLYAYSQRLGVPSDACHVPGVVGNAIAQACATYPSICVIYRSGRHAGEGFSVADYDARLDLRDGGAGFDQGWAGAMMIEAALTTPDRERAARYRDSALAAADWALVEPAVRNHNYTAKLIWLLALAYDWTGEARYREGLIDKLERSLLPSVLMDEDRDGEVDGVPGVRFDALRSPLARRPGRLWDAHNALPWYQAMNAVALVEAHAALHARGDAAWSARLRPYVLAVLDNLASEIAEAGGLSTDYAGSSQPPHAFALALWKFADVEGLARPQWEQALWTAWNSGLATAPGDNKTATTAIVALRAAGVRHRPLRERVAASAAQLPLDARVSGFWYDPDAPGEGLSLSQIEGGTLVATWYTFTPQGDGAQAWLVASGPFDGVNFDAEVSITRGGRFDARFDPASVQTQPWGRLQISFASCDAATLSWQSSEAGYGRGVRSLRRLASIDGFGC